MIKGIDQSAVYQRLLVDLQCDVFHGHPEPEQMQMLTDAGELMFSDTLPPVSKRVISGCISRLLLSQLRFTLSSDVFGAAVDLADKWNNPL